MGVQKVWLGGGRYKGCGEGGRYEGCKVGGGRYEGFR